MTVTVAISLTPYNFRGRHVHSDTRVQVDEYKKGSSSVRVKRHQFPIAPDFARTAYSMQGQTLQSAIVDLNFDKTTNPVTAYVALSRVCTSQDILIMQPFTLQPFQQGVPPDADMLLNHLRGKSISDELAARAATLEKEKEKQRQKISDVRAKAGSSVQTGIDPKEVSVKHGKRASRLTKAEIYANKNKPAEGSKSELKHRCAQCKKLKTVDLFGCDTSAWRNRRNKPEKAICLACKAVTGVPRLKARGRPQGGDKAFATCQACGKRKPVDEFGGRWDKAWRTCQDEDTGTVLKCLTCRTRM